MDKRDPPSQPESSLHEIRAARDHAEFLRDQLQSEYNRLVEEEELLEMIQPDAFKTRILPVQLAISRGTS